MATPTYTDCYRPNKAGKDGYCRKRIWDKVNKRYYGMKLHRWAYEQAFGAIPEGFEIDHMCHNEAVAKGECKGGKTCPHRSCINPEHLRAVTKSENQKAGLSGFDNRTHCAARGHELTSDNIYTFMRGDKQCQECLACRRENAKLATRRYRARKRVQIAN